MAIEIDALQNAKSIGWADALFARLAAGSVQTPKLSPVGGTITTDLPVINGTVTWNAGGVTFTADKINVTDTSSASGSLLIDRQVGGTSKFKVSKAGLVTCVGVTSSDVVTVSGTRPVVVSGSVGTTTYKGDAGGWIVGDKITGSSDTVLGYIGAIGNTDALTAFVIGTIGDYMLQLAATTGNATFKGSVGVGAAPSNPLDIQVASGAIRVKSTTGTNAALLKFENTGGTTYFGVDSSTGGALTGTAYAAAINTPSDFVVVVNSVAQISSNASRTLFGGSVALATKTIATLPSAASSTGERYQLSDSATVTNRIAFSNGTAWYYEGTAAAV